MKNITPVFLALLVTYAAPCVAQQNLDLNPGSAAVVRQNSDLLLNHDD